ncbi:MAG TPA: decarboxylating 6-phosphogluconate dehydrogenase [Ignavibacteriaceae bacterium]|nr:decarboxylating 6-phosphogluconate dehydrogenase [Ignavibacteriaceae bacterium]
MKLGFIGLGKMGFNMVQRILNDGHQVVAWTRSGKTVQEIKEKGAIAASSIEELVSNLSGKKIVWMMVPSGKPVDDNLDLLLSLLKKDDIIIDGGNSYWKETQVRNKKAAEKGIHYIDCGTSGGIWGLKEGYCLMYGGNKQAADFCEPIFKTLAPENGFLYCGESGAGHFVKMVHNGIEYGMMQAYAEGFEIMKKSQFNIDLTKVSKVWQYGSVVRSWLLELAHLALSEDPMLEKIKGFVQDSGEGRWTIQTAIELDVPAHVITSSLYTRFQSRQDESFAMKLLAALRNQFGGHAVKSKE